MWMSRAQYEDENAARGPGNFGGNNGKQGIFDPEDEATSQLALQRLQQLVGEYGERLRPNFTGDTGLAKNDADGFYKMQNAKVEAQNIQRILSGDQPLQVKFNPRGAQNMQSHTQRGLGQFRGQLVRNSPLQGLDNAYKPLPESHQNFMKRYGRG